MNVQIFADIFECVTGAQVLHRQLYHRERGYSLTKDGTETEFQVPSCGIYIMSAIGTLELHIKHSLIYPYGIPTMSFDYYLEHNLIGFSHSDIEEMVVTQLENEAFLSNVKPENTHIKRNLTNKKEN